MDLYDFQGFPGARGGSETQGIIRFLMNSGGWFQRIPRILRNTRFYKVLADSEPGISHPFKNTQCFGNFSLDFLSIFYLCSWDPLNMGSDPQYVFGIPSTIFQFAGRDSPLPGISQTNPDSISPVRVEFSFPQ